MTRERGGTVEVTCGACGNRAMVEVRPSRANHGVALIVERSMRRAGWQLVPPWDWVEHGCLRAARKAARAGHVQVPLF